VEREPELEAPNLLHREPLDAGLVKAFGVSAAVHVVVILSSLLISHATRSALEPATSYTVGLVDLESGSPLLDLGPLGDKPPGSRPSVFAPPTAAAAPAAAPPPAKAPEVAPEAKPEPPAPPKPEPKVEAKPAPKPEPKIEPKAEPKPEPKVEAKPAPKPKPEAKPTPKPEPKPAKPEPKPAAKPEAKTAAKPEPKPVAKAAAKPEASSTKTVAKAVAASAKKEVASKGSATAASSATSKAGGESASATQVAKATPPGGGGGGSMIPGSGQGGGGPPGAEVRSPEFVAYYEHVLRTIRRGWVTQIADANIRTTVGFSILADGRLATIRTVESSGDPRFDLSVLNAVRAAQGQLGPPPEQYRRDFSDVQILFRPGDMVE
jgi:TolA protein